MKFSGFFGINCLILVVFLGGFISAAPSATMTGIRNNESDALLRQTFTNAVNNYLRRYDPKLLEQKDGYVKMTAKYDYQLDIELKITRGAYEIIVTSPDKDNKKAQTICDKIVAGVYRAFTNYLAKPPSAN